MHWDTAPENPARLAAAGVPIALTSFGLAEPGDFLQQLRLAVRRGFNRDAALRALTVTPAVLFGMGQRLGTLEPGKIASLVIVDGDVFDEKAKIVETWVEGRRYVVQPAPEVEVRGTWIATLNGGNGTVGANGNGAASGPKDDAREFTIDIKGEGDKLSGSLRRGDKRVDLTNVQLTALQLNCSFDAKVLDREGTMQQGTMQQGTMQQGIVQLSATISARTPRRTSSPPSSWARWCGPMARQTSITGKQTVVLASVSEQGRDSAADPRRRAAEDKEGAKHPPAKEPEKEPKEPPAKERKSRRARKSPSRRRRATMCRRNRRSRSKSRPSRRRRPRPRACRQCSL